MRPRPEFRIILLTGALLVSLVGCTVEEAPFRPECVREKMADQGYTREYATQVCQGQYYQYGDKKPEYEVKLDDLQQEIEQQQKLREYCREHPESNIC